MIVEVALTPALEDNPTASSEPYQNLGLSKREIKNA
jgi:hypothetical protein